MKAALIIFLIVAALAIAGGSYFYASSLKNDYADQFAALSGQARDLSDRLGTLETALDALAARPAPTPFDPSGLQADIDATTAALAALGGTVNDVTFEVAGVTSQAADLAAQLDAFDARLSDAESVMRRAGIDAAGIYERVVETVVRIADGRQVIGSGFIYSSGGLVITANHVIEGLTPIYVIMHDGRASEASVVGASVPSDVALLQLADNPGLAPVPLADSTLAAPGDPVVAIGSPDEGDQSLGLRDTLTAGVISQVDRFVTVDTNAVANLVQFDAPVNPGNSGCPLFDARGNIVGLVIARISASVGDGLYWAVASGKVKRVADEIIATGVYRYPWLGVNIFDPDPLTAVDLGLASTSGVLVSSVAVGSPASLAGFNIDDVITAMDGRPVRDLDELVSFLALYYSPGDVFNITVLRNGQTLTLSGAVGERP